MLGDENWTLIRGSPYRPAASEDAVKEGLTEERIVHTPNGSETSCITGGNDRRLYTKYRQPASGRRQGVV